MDVNEAQKVEIQFDNDRVNYTTGQTISGKVVLKLYKELIESRVNIVLRGKSKVSWTESASVAGDTTHYLLEEEFLTIRYEIPESAANAVIPKGFHDIPFSIRLPEFGIPSSLSTDYGYIDYWVEVFVADSAFDDYRQTRYINIEASLNDETKSYSISGSVEKDIRYLCLGSGNVRIEAMIHQKGHQKGKSVDMNCIVENKSTTSVTPRASLYQTQIFMASGKHKTIVEPMKPTIGTEVQSGHCSDQIISVPIPDDIPLTIKTKLISVKYFIHVTLDIPYAIDLHLNLPIIVTNK